MAKKADSNNLEEIAFQELVKKAHKQIEASQRIERSKKVLQVGKELVMLLRWLKEVLGDLVLTEEQIQVHIMQLLEGYPKEAKKVLAYSETLKGLSVKWNFEGFTCSGDCKERGRLWLAFSWFSLDPPKDAGAEGEK